MSLNKGRAVMLVSPTRVNKNSAPTNPPGIELYSYANVFFVLVEKHAHRSRQ